VLQFRASPFDLSLREILASIVDRLELAAIDGYRRFRQQPHLAAQLHELRAHLLDGWAVVLSEIGNRLVIGCESAQQPITSRLRDASRSGRRLD
jgi:hypothetical protein